MFQRKETADIAAGWLVPAFLFLLFAADGLAPFSPAAIFFGGITVALAAFCLSSRTLPVPPYVFATAVCAATLWAGITLMWSPAPDKYARWALLFFIALIVACSFSEPFLESHRARANLVLRCCAVGALLGVSLTFVELSFGSPIFHSIHHGRQEPLPLEYYNAAMTFAALLAWPLAAAFWIRHRRGYAVATLLIALGLILTGVSLSGTLAMAAALIVFAAGRYRPRATGRTALAVVAIVFAMAPLAFGNILDWVSAEGFPEISKHILVRVEIWNHVAARIQERPIFGWGFAASGHVPLFGDEIEKYRILRHTAVHPHNNVLQIWAELGAGGAVIALSIWAVAIRNIRRLDQAAWPFALAATAAAFSVYLVSYNVWRPYWLAQLAATAFLFAVLCAPLRPSRPT